MMVSGWTSVPDADGNVNCWMDGRLDGFTNRQFKRQKQPTGWRQIDRRTGSMYGGIGRTNRTADNLMDYYYEQIDRQNRLTEMDRRE